jgi:hypothetical protein
MIDASRSQAFGASCVGSAIPPPPSHLYYHSATPAIGCSVVRMPRVFFIFKQATPLQAFAQDPRGHVAHVLILLTEAHDIAANIAGVITIVKQIIGLPLNCGRCGQQLTELLDNQILYRRVALRRESFTRAKLLYRQTIQKRPIHTTSRDQSGKPKAPANLVTG